MDLLELGELVNLLIPRGGADPLFFQGFIRFQYLWPPSLNEWLHLSQFPALLFLLQLNDIKRKHTIEVRWKYKKNST